MTGDKVVEVSVRGGKGRTPWRPSRSFDEGGGQPKAVPPWADPDAQPPPPPSSYYSGSVNAAASRWPTKPATTMAASVQSNPNPIHFNRPSPGASPVPVRKCLFRTNVPLKSLSTESLNKPLPWVASRRDTESKEPPSETSTLCPMVMTGDSRSRSRGQMSNRVSSRSTSLPRVGHTGGETVLAHNNLPAGEHMAASTGRDGRLEAPPYHTPVQSEGMDGRSAKEIQSGPRPQCYAQPGSHGPQHTGADLPDSADAKHHPPERMVSAKPTVEAKGSPPATQQQQEQGSPTPWRKARPAPEQSSPTPWRKNVASQDSAAKAAPSQQQQPSWLGSKGDVSAGLVSEGHTTSSTAKGQEVPWRRGPQQQTASVQPSADISSSSTTISSTATVKQTQVLQQSHVSVNVRSEEVIKVKSEAEANLSSQVTSSQPNWRKQQPKTQPGTQPAPYVSTAPHPSPAPTSPPFATQPPVASTVTSAVVTKDVIAAPAASKPVSASPDPAVSKVASPAPAVNKPASPAPSVSHTPSPVPAPNKLVSPAPSAGKPSSPAPTVSKPVSPVPPAVSKPVSSSPAVSKPASPSPAVSKQTTSVTSKVASPPAAKKAFSPPPVKRASPPPAVKKAVSPTPEKKTISADVNKPPSALVSSTAIHEQVSAITDVNKNICVEVSSLPVSGVPEKVKIDKSGDASGEFLPPPKTETTAPPIKEAAPPLAPVLADTHSPTPPLPPKQTAAAVVSVPALPQTPKPPIAPSDQPVPPTPTSQAIPPPPPTQPILPSQISETQKSTQQPGTVAAPLPSSASVPTTRVPSPTPVSVPPVVTDTKSAEQMTSALSPLPTPLSMPVPSPPPAPVPIPPPEPIPKSVISGPPSPATGETPKAKKVEVNDKVTPGVEPQASPSPSKPPENVPTTSPHPEFPPPPPLEESEPPTTSVEMDQALPPPPSFIHESKPVTPPTMLMTEHEDRGNSEDDDFPSPEYVRESVTKRIKAFEKQASKDEDPQAADRQTPTAKPVAPWVKKTSSGPVNQEGYWDMTSPEEEKAWTVPPFIQRDLDPAKSRPRPQTKDSTASGAKSSSTPPPPPSTPTAGARGPQGSKAALQKGRAPPPARQRSTSIGDYHAQYFPPEEFATHSKMPAEGEVLATTPEVKPGTPTKGDDALFDPWCDPKNPRVINFQDVSAAAFKIKSGIMNTPCTRSHMSSFTDMEIYFKKEFNQYTGSFKERGARYTLLMLTDEQKKKGVIAASAGNHALALCYHGQDLGIPVTVVMPLVAPIMKVQACRQYGANVIVKGNDIGECREIALRMAKDQVLLYINGYDHPHILAGQGTMGLEIVEQVKDIDAVVIPVGGGGLIAGVALAVKALYPHIKVIGVESERCASFGEAMKAGRPVYVKAESTLADGLAVPRVGVNAFATASKLVDKVVTVREEWIAIAILRLVECEKAVVEGAGATALAAILAGELPELKGKRIVIPLCGGNIDTTVLGRCLERGLAADGRLVKFTVTVSDRPGGIAELTRLLANLGVSIKDMMHERAWIKNDIFSVEVKVIAETRDHEHSRELKTALECQYARLRFVNPDQIHDDC